MKNFGFIADCHEYLHFDRKPQDAELVGLLEEYCRGLALRAALTREEKSVSEMQLAMTITVEGSSYGSEDIVQLYEGIDKLADADGFTLDIATAGCTGDFTVWELEDREGSYLDGMILRCGEVAALGLYAFMSNYRTCEDFVCKLVEFVGNSGEIITGKIAHGEVVNLKEAMSRDILSVKNENWWSSQLMLGVEFELENHPVVAEQLRQAVCSYLPEYELEFVKRRWEEAAEDNENYVSLFECTQIEGNLNEVEMFFREISGIISPVGTMEDVLTADDCIWIDIENFGVASCRAEEDGLHIVGTMF